MAAVTPAGGNGVAGDVLPGGRDAPLPGVRDASLQGAAQRSLRAATDAAHRSLGGLAAPTAMTRAAYVRYLVMAHASVPIEIALDAAGVRGLLPDWTVRERRFALLEDMGTLGVRPPPSRALSIAGDPGTLLGWAYVLEGSRLGAPLIRAAVMASPDRSLRAATRFLRHGVGNGFWTSFRRVLAGIDGDRAATVNACAAARLAFQCFIDASHPAD